MKTFTVLLSLLLTSVFVQAQEESTEGKRVTPVQWEEKEHDFGEIAFRVPATATFTFQNISDEPVVISNVRSSCGCTVADYTKEPVNPGQKGEVKATYNSARVGMFQKTVTVTLGGVEQPVVLRIKGNVVEKTEEGAKEEEKETPPGEG